MPHPILLYDGVCGLCNRLTQFILRRDRNATFQFAPLQRPLAARILARHGANPADLDSVYVVLSYNQPDESLLARSDAILFVLKQLRVCHLAGRLVALLPRSLRDRAYGVVARNRYRVFGRYDSCPIPSPAVRGRFLDL
jgi:predicted DCC family thiol-disulfide oxidoreductase YuxK